MPLKKEEQKEEILFNLELQAKKMAFLLANLKAPREVKEAFISLLPYLSPKQVGKFLEVLEAKYLNWETKDIDEKLAKDLQKVVADFQQSQEQTEKELLLKLANIEKQIPQI